MTEIYLAVWIATLSADAMLCAALGRRYNLCGSILVTGLWPITTPTILLTLAYCTRKQPRFDFDWMKKSKEQQP